MKHNQYFNGKVQSLGFNGPEGPATVGVMEPGTYTFNTQGEERISIFTGNLKIKLPGSKDWQAVEAGDSFTIPGNSSYEVDVASDTAYICFYK
ncbi:MAG: pyrimidine/purine nucleoside phosphorylase [Spirochaetes bacterium]|nr:pyrimidine/purine nucleoside phosphorylase [Spirochaetota bacterium]